MQRTKISAVFVKGGTGLAFDAAVSIPWGGTGHCGVWCRCVIGICQYLRMSGSDVFPFLERILHEEKKPTTFDHAGPPRPLLDLARRPKNRP